MWHREGSYDAIAERLFNGLNHRRLLLEYDTERAGSFAPLRFVPKDKIVVLGLITTKAGRTETVDELRRRIDDAARYLPVERLALSPQCGFASSIMGNLLTEDEQFRKFDVMLETAARVWG
jgi:5-methyltetrahydropteroyltriglutamate--homocysteine methyltransferase